jgi:D-alanyl-D-alanine carboxypeptidase/D-alanyl-D-alanine-endopeptidase (penicillin-binding protein 4)
MASLVHPGLPRSIRRSRALAAISVCAATCLLSVRPGAAAPDAAPDLSRETGLVQRVRAAIDEAKLGELLGVSIVDARSGRVVFAYHADRPLDPASNQKLVTAAAALTELGPDYRMLTGLYGELQGSAVVSGLYLKGYGDPTLTDADLRGLVQQLVARGVRQVDEVIVDGSYFDGQTLPPGFERQPEEISAFRAAVGAVSVNANAFTLRVSPGAQAGAPAQVWVDAEGYFALQNELATTDGGGPKVIASQRTKDDKLQLRVSGTVPVGSPSVAYKRRVESPLHYAGYALVEALRDQRIQVPRRVRLAKLPAGSALLASRRSPPLSLMLHALGKQSDNFTAEMLLQVLGAERVGVPGKAAHGARVALSALQKIGVSTGGMKVLNGSGLFADNRVSAAQLTALLRAVFMRPELAPEFMAHLAIGGLDGTLSERFEQLPSPRTVRAKTGTLASVVALSGYALGRTPERVFAFSVLANEVGGKVGQARALADQVASACAFHLWSADKPIPMPKAAPVPR